MEEKDTRIALAVSVVVHMCLLVFFVAAPVFTGKRPVEIVKTDLSFLGYGTDYPSPVRGQGAVKAPIQPHGGKNASPKPLEPARPVGKVRHGPAIEERTEPPAAIPTLGIMGRTIVRDSPSTHTNRSDSAGYYGIGSGAGGNAPTAAEGREGSCGHGTGKGSLEGIAAGDRDYSYIRDAVLRNVIYPEEARRLGIEGKVVISFIVLEDGTTDSIELLKGSGHRFLDENARKAVTTARINRKVPYRVMVQLPITFRLQGKKGS